jgi:hypothetical protein
LTSRTIAAADCAESQVQLIAAFDAAASWVCSVPAFANSSVTSSSSISVHPAPASTATAPPLAESTPMAPTAKFRVGSADGASDAVSDWPVATVEKICATAD